MIPVPHTYAAWADVFDGLKNHTDDEAVLRAMEQGTIEWQAGVAERFIQRLMDAVNTRMNAAIDKFQRDFGRSGGQESAIVQAIWPLRRELSFFGARTGTPALPEKERAQLRRLVPDQADSIQKSLEDSAQKNDRSGRLASIVRRHRVNAL